MMDIEPDAARHEVAARGAAPTPDASTYLVRRVDHDAPADRAMVERLLDEYLSPIPGEDAGARYRWLYLDNPCGRARTYLAVSRQDGTPVGVTSLFPRRVQVGRVEAIGAIGGDAYVTPSFRRRGIVTELHRLAHEDMKSGSPAFMFGPPEPNNLRALMHAGALVTGSVRLFSRPFTVRGLGQRASKGHYRVLRRFSRVMGWMLRAPRSSLRLEALDHHPNPRVDDLWRAVRRDVEATGGVVPVSDAAFFAWRFGRCVSGAQRAFLVTDRGTPLGAVALEKKDGRVGLVHVTCPPGDFQAVVRAVLQHARDADAVHVQLHVPTPGRRHEAALAALGFLPRGTKPFQVQSPESSPYHELVTRHDAWSYMWGDGDVDHVL